MFKFAIFRFLSGKQFSRSIKIVTVLLLCIYNAATRYPSKSSLSIDCLIFSNAFFSIRDT